MLTIRSSRIFLPHRIAGVIGLLFLITGAAYVLPRTAKGKNSITRGISTTPESSARRATSTFQNGVAEPDSQERTFQFASDPLPPFRVTDLSATLPPDHSAELLTLTENGSVLATVSPPLPPPLPNGRPARRAAIRSRAGRYREGKWELLPIPQKTHRILGGDMNQRGDVVAVSIFYRRGKPSYNRLCFYPGSTTQLVDLGTLDPAFEHPDTHNPPTMRGVAEGMVSLNDRGTIVSMVGTKTWFRTQSGRVGQVPGGVIYDLSENDSAVGVALQNAGTAALWHNITAPKNNAKSVSLMPQTDDTTSVGEKQSVQRRGTAECLNDRGDAVVSLPIETPGGSRRIVRTMYYVINGQTGQIQTVAQLRGFQGMRTRMNNYRDVVGFVDVMPETFAIKPLLYRNGKIYDMENVARKSGWLLVHGVDINDRGQILAYGYRVTKTGERSKLRAILLTPVSGKR